MYNLTKNCIIEIKDTFQIINNVFGTSYILVYIYIYFEMLQQNIFSHKISKRQDLRDEKLRNYTTH